MGFRYFLFRVKYLLLTKSGVLKKRFPSSPPSQNFIELESWRKLNIPFFFTSKEDLNVQAIDFDEVEERRTIEKIKEGTFTFFSSQDYDLGVDYDWLTNPDTGFKYDVTKHWSEVADLSKEAGDIKYVWEKSRFSWAYKFLRFDIKTGEDHAEFVLSEIESFIDANPINQGPNYKCSQEISLRLLNWTYVLFYYRDSRSLNPELFQKIINSIYWQLHHVYNNIDFSRISVRNNHAITETLMLFLSGILYPFIPETKHWSKKGKQWFEEEVAYQVYDDGSFLQFSHNYHRVVIQLLTWGIKLAELNDIQLSKVVYKRAKASVLFLFNHQDETTGWLPNYGMNDGALFFPLGNSHYRNYSPQLQGLAHVLGFELYSKVYDDTHWFSLENTRKQQVNYSKLLRYEDGGFYGFKDQESLTTVRCGTYRDRPAQADALHLDIWYKGENILFDPGTFKYNTEEEYLKFYHGTNGHNTLTIGEHSQMLKGGRFIWYYWTKAFNQRVVEKEDCFEFEGSFFGFKELGDEIIHKRTIIKYKNSLTWKITDETNYKGRLPIRQHWNIKKGSKVRLEAKDSTGDLTVEKVAGWYSDQYGAKESFEQLVFNSNQSIIETTIEIVL